MSKVDGSSPSSLVNCKLNSPVLALASVPETAEGHELLKVTQAVRGRVRIRSGFLTPVTSEVMLVFLLMVALCWKDRCHILAKPTSNSL